MIWINYVTVTLCLNQIKPLSKPRGSNILGAELVFNPDKNKSELHCVSKNVPPLQLAIIVTYAVGINVAEKVGNQNILYFPITPNLCFCTTWGNTKPGNCIFSLKCCMLFHEKTRNTVKNITWSELNISTKKYQNPFMWVKVIASQRWDVFWDTV